MLDLQDLLAVTSLNTILTSESLPEIAEDEVTPLTVSPRPLPGTSRSAALTSEYTYQR